MTVNPLLEAALAYAARGWPVFPCRASDSPELDDKGNPKWSAKAPLIGKGWKAASTHPELIEGWWRRWPDALIGLPMGGTTGIFALDFDPRDVADPDTGEVISFTLAQLKADTEAMIGCALPSTVAQMTPSKGVHAFFLQPRDGGPDIRNKGCLPNHVDVRGDGGYVIVPPSVVQVNHKGASGPYRWLRGELLEVEPAEAPQILIDVLRAPKGSKVVDGVLVLPAAAGDSAGIDADDDAARRSARAAPTDAIGEGRRRYGLALLSKLTDELGRAHEGSRGETLNRAGFALGGAVGAGILSGAIAAHELAAAADRCGLTAKDGLDAVRSNIARSLKDGEARPLDLAEVDRESEERAARPMGSRRGRAPAGRIAAAPASPPKAEATSITDGEGPEAEGLEAPDADDASLPGDPPSDEEPEEEPPSHLGGGRDDGMDLGGAALDEWCGWRPLTDLGNAERFRARFGKNYHFTVAGGWLVWDGKRWEPYHHGKPPRALLMDAQACVRQIGREAMAVSSKRRKGALREWARKSEAAGKINAIVSLFQPMATVREEIFDTDPLLFNVQNGTLEFAKGEGDKWGVTLRSHRRTDMITKVGLVPYDPKALCPEYDAFLEEVQPDPEVRDFLHRWAGLGLTGRKIQKLVQHYGTGRNGKGTMTELHAHIAGDYAGTINIESLLAANSRSGQGASPDIAKLPGIRFLRVTEPEEGSVLAEALVKRLTGGDPIDARHNYGPFFTFKPVFKLSFQGNYKLKIKGTDAGIWGRMRLVKWNISIPDDRQDEGLPARLLGEGSGVLNHLVSGALAVLAHGLAEPAAVREETQNYRDESDPVGQFLAMCTQREAGVRTGASTMHEVYSAWARWTKNVDRSGKPLSTTKFRERLETANYKSHKSGNQYWLDVRLVKAVSDFLDHHGNPLPIPDDADSEAAGAPSAPPAPAEWEAAPPSGRQGWEDDW